MGRSIGNRFKSAVTAGALTALVGLQACAPMSTEEKYQAQTRMLTFGLAGMIDAKYDTDGANTLDLAKRYHIADQQQPVNIQINNNYGNGSVPENSSGFPATTPNGGILVWDRTLNGGKGGHRYIYPK